MLPPVRLQAHKVNFQPAIGTFMTTPAGRNFEQALQQSQRPILLFRTTLVNVLVSAGAPRDIAERNILGSLDRHLVGDAKEQAEVIRNTWYLVCGHTGTSNGNLLDDRMRYGEKFACPAAILHEVEIRTVVKSGLCSEAVALSGGWVQNGIPIPNQLPNGKYATAATDIEQKAALWIVRMALLAVMCEKKTTCLALLVRYATIGNALQVPYGTLRKIDNFPSRGFCTLVGHGIQPNRLQHTGAFSTRSPLHDLVLVAQRATALVLASAQCMSISGEIPTVMEIEMKAGALTVDLDALNAAISSACSTAGTLGGRCSFETTT